MECVARQLVLTFESCTSGTLGAGSVCEWPVVSVVLTDRFGLHRYRYAGEGSVLHVGVWRVRVRVACSSLSRRFRSSSCLHWYAGPGEGDRVCGHGVYM